jgi:hypothetical protein
MQLRKSSVESAIVTRGHTFTTTSSEQTIPAATTIVSARSLAPSQNKMGANHRRLMFGTAPRMTSRYPVTGNRPRSPIRPWI